MQFYSEYSFWWILPILFISYLTTFIFFKNANWITNVSPWIRKILFSLRFTTISLILSLLLGIFFEDISYKTEKPILITVVDNSSSMKNYKDSSTVLTAINRLDSSLNSTFSDKYSIKTFTLGSQFKQNKSFLFNENQSNLQFGFESIANQFYNRNIGAIIFISDGNFNKGINPIYSAKNIPLAPIFTIGVGDTLPKKDQVILDVTNNDFAFLRSKFQVEVFIEGSKLQHKNSKINLLHHGKIIKSKQIIYNKEIDNQKITFEIEADKIGFQQYTINLSPIENEYTYKNNSYSFYIEIIDNRNKVLLLSGAPHPDLTALKSTIEKDENIQVQIANSTKWKDEYASTDLVIWHEPGIEFSPITLDKLKALKKPIFYFIGPNTSSLIINQLNLGFNPTQSRQTDEVQAALSNYITVFDIPSDISKEIGFFPPVFVKYGDLNFTNDIEVLLYQKLGNIIKKEPLLFFGKRNQGNYGVFYGEGIWKWKFYEYSKTKSTKTVDQLFQKVFTYLMIKQNKSALHVTLPRKFTSKDEVKIKAEFYNPSLELITSPEIKFELINRANKKSVYQFGVTSNYYILPLGKLQAGEYSWKASCLYGGKKHYKKGSFIVENELIEQIDTKANHFLLRQIAKNSNAQFLHLKNTTQLMKIINNRKDIVNVSYEHKTNHDLLDFAWIFIIIITLLTAEWFLRKWFGGY